MVFLWRPAAVGPRLGLAGASMWAMFAMGCGPATGDPEPDAEPDVAPACDVALIDPGALQVSPSAEAIVLELDVGRAERLSFVFVGAPTGFIVESAPDGVDAELEGEGVPSTLRLVVHASAEPGEVVVRADCDGASGTLGFQVEGARPRWDAFPSWTPGTGGPPGREYFNMWLDDTDPGRLFVFGGFHYEPVQFTVAWDLWSLDLGAEAWTALTPAGEPPHLAGGRLAVGPEAGRGLHYGGLGEEDGSFLLPFSLVEVDWSGADVSFTTLTAASAPATGTYQPAFLYDAPRDRYLAVGGQGAAAIHADVSAYDPSSMTWSSVAVSSLDVPSGRTGFFWVHDDANERVVVFSGEQGGGAGGTCNCAQDTWALELGEAAGTTDGSARWVLLAGDDASPPGRRNGAYVLDAQGHRMLVWGGTADGATTSPGLWAFSLERGHEGWTELLVDADGAAPAIRSSGAAVYDAAQDRVLVGFGNDSIVGAHVDLWSLSF